MGLRWCQAQKSLVLKKVVEVRLCLGCCWGRTLDLWRRVVHTRGWDLSLGGDDGEAKEE